MKQEAGDDAGATGPPRLSRTAGVSPAIARRTKPKNNNALFLINSRSTMSKTEPENKPEITTSDERVKDVSPITAIISANIAFCNYNVNATPLLTSHPFHRRFKAEGDAMRACVNPAFPLPQFTRRENHGVSRETGARLQPSHQPKIRQAI